MIGGHNLRNFNIRSFWIKFVVLYDRADILKVYFSGVINKENSVGIADTDGYWII
jgi:hypothetical protein